jgi:hypothetical protein
MKTRSDREFEIYFTAAVNATPRQSMSLLKWKLSDHVAMPFCLFARGASNNYSIRAVYIDTGIIWWQARAFSDDGGSTPLGIYDSLDDAKANAEAHEACKPPVHGRVYE